MQNKKKMKAIKKGKSQRKHNKPQKFSKNGTSLPM